MTVQRLDIEQALPQMQALASRLWSATAASVSALTAARHLGATTSLVCPRGDDDYPAPARLYRKIGFVPGARTRTYRRG